MVVGCGGPVLILFIGGVWYFAATREHTAVAPVAQKVRPGGDKAVLTLEDGRQVVLDSSVKGMVAKQEGVTITQKKEGLLTYEGTAADAAGTLNTLTVPPGGQFQVVLPDSSHVWLNSASSLRYPTVFSGGTREVELTGEGYFEIRHHAGRPFFVRCGALRVEVLGTGFDVMGYADEPAPRVALVEGSVAVHSGQDRVVIRPGQQAEPAGSEGRLIVRYRGYDAGVGVAAG